MLLVFALLTARAESAAPAAVEQREIDAPPSPPSLNSGDVWPSEPPTDCPFPPSETLKHLQFTGRHAEVADSGADTWYPSWAADGNLYSPWADGTVNGVSSSARAAIQRRDMRPSPATIR